MASTHHHHLARSVSQLQGGDENAEVVVKKTFGAIAAAAASDPVSIKAAAILDCSKSATEVSSASESQKVRSIRKFGAPIDANRKRSLSSSGSKQKPLKSTLKKLEKPSTTVITSSANNKRAAEEVDDNGSGDSVVPPVKRHSPEKKASVVAKKETTTTTISEQASTSLSKEEEEEEVHDLDNLVIPSDAELISMYPAEQQIKWMCTPDGANQDPDYYAMLIHHRMQALVETWAENDRLAAELAELKAEKALLDPLFEKVIELKEYLLATAADADA